MKKYFVALGLCGLLFSASSLACQGILNAAVKGVGTLGVFVQLGAGAAAYFSSGEVTLPDQKYVYWAEAGAYGVAAVALLAAISCRPIGGMNTAAGSMAVLAGLAGAATATAAYFLNTHRDIVTWAAFFGGLGGTALNWMASLLAALQRRCIRSDLEAPLI